MSIKNLKIELEAAQDQLAYLEGFCYVEVDTGRRHYHHPEKLAATKAEILRLEGAIKSAESEIAWAQHGGNAAGAPADMAAAALWSKAFARRDDAKDGAKPPPNDPEAAAMWTKAFASGT